MILYIILVFTLFGKYSIAEIHSSISHIKQELKRIRGDNSIEMIKKLLVNQDTDTINIERFIGTLGQLEAGARDPDFTVHHPLDAYRFIRNHSIIYNETVTELLNEMQRINQDHTTIRTLAQNFIALSKDDLIGALKGIIRIQYTYDIKTQDLADGNVLGQYRRHMTAEECKDMMAIAFYSDLTNLALEWFDASLKRIEAGDETIAFTKLLCKAAACAFDVGSDNIAVQISDYILKDNPKSRYLRHKMKYFQGNSKHNVFKVSNIYDDFRDSCRKSIEPEQKKNIRKENSCLYIDNGHPFLRFQPGKVEIVSSDPLIFIFHDAFTPRTLSMILEPIKPYLSRSVVYGNATHTSVSEGRTSKGINLQPDDGIITNLYRYVGALVSLQPESFETFQITNYGIGGHYGLHYDSFNPEMIETAFSSNQRIATFMIYLTDVEKGGATVFPMADVSVLPKAGNAVFWYNLNPDGSLCQKTPHAACPVISGDKYIGNIWVRERGQAFNRPCNLVQKDIKHKWPLK